MLVKLSWAIYKKAMIENMPLLTAENPKTVYKNARKIFKTELEQLDEYGPCDVLKTNLTYAVMIYSIYASCDTKPDVSTLSKFCRNVVLTPKLAGTLLAKVDVTSEKSISHQLEVAEKSRNATHPYTWQYEITETGNRRFTAEFSRCGIYDYFRSKGLTGLVPALCMMDFAYCDVQRHIFLRKQTIATGGKICDCTYISKSVATNEEMQEYKNDMENEAVRGGIVLK